MKPFVQFSLRLQPEDGEVLAALAADAGVKPGRMLHRMVGEALGKRRGELLLSARVGPAVGTRKDRAGKALAELSMSEALADPMTARHTFAAAQALPPPLVEEASAGYAWDDEPVVDEPNLNVEEGHAPQGYGARDCPATVGAYRCQLPVHAEGVSHQWGR